MGIGNSDVYLIQVGTPCASPFETMIINLSGSLLLA
jgi:hypothetical protein